MKVFGPQPGPQSMFFSSTAKIVIYGGAAGGGKTYGGLLEGLRNVQHPEYRGGIFRRTNAQHKKSGGPWDESFKMYPSAGGIANLTELKWKFPSGSSISFNHLQRENSKLEYQGTQFGYMFFDELTHFTESQFFYMLSRLRSMTGKSYVRCSCNPDSESWVRQLIDWWIGPDGLPIKERSGVIRWFIRDPDTDQLIWHDSEEESEEYIIENYNYLDENKRPKKYSLTFISATLDDNKELTSKDPSYAAALTTLPKVEREQLRSGNWNIRLSAGEIFKADHFQIVNSLPPEEDIVAWVRAWDRAATTPTKDNPDPDYTASVKMCIDNLGIIYIVDVTDNQIEWDAVMRLMKAHATNDGDNCTILYFKDPAAAAKGEVKMTTSYLGAFPQWHFPAQNTGGKYKFSITHAQQAQAGNVKLLAAPWNGMFTRHMENFGPNQASTKKDKKVHDDIADAANLGVYYLINEIDSLDIDNAFGGDNGTNLLNAFNALNRLGF